MALHIDDKTAATGLKITMSSFSLYFLYVGGSTVGGSFIHLRKKTLFVGHGFATTRCIVFLISCHVYLFHFSLYFVTIWYIHLLITFYVNIFTCHKVKTEIKRWPVGACGGVQPVSSWTVIYPPASELLWQNFWRLQRAGSVLQDEWLWLSLACVTWIIGKVDQRGSLTPQTRGWEVGCKVWPCWGVWAMGGWAP